MWQKCKILFAVLGMATLVSVLYSVRRLYSPKDVFTNSAQNTSTSVRHSMLYMYFPMGTPNSSLVHQMNMSATNSVQKLYNSTNPPTSSATQQLFTAVPQSAFKYPLSNFIGFKQPPSNFVMALSYFDQQTSALWRLRSLQCWAKDVGDFGVVAPVVKKSELRVQPLQPANQVMDLGNIYDMNYLARIDLPSSGFAPLVEWAYVRKSCNKSKVILVHMEYNDKWHHAKTSPYVDEVYTFLKETDSVIHRNVTINVTKEVDSRMTMDNFTELLFGNLTDIENVVLIFDEWRGISGSYIPVMDGNCQVGKFQATATRIPFSSWIARDAQRYIGKFLQNKDYISLMIRTEIGMKTCDGVERFLNRVYDVWISLKKSTHLESTFLSVDAGSFGSIRYSVRKYFAKCKVVEHVQNFFQRIYSGSLNMSDWEQSFVEVSGTTHAGYIAVLQKAVTVRAKCIVLAGGGNFQYHAVNIYKSLHKKHSDRCIRTLWA